MCIDKVAVVIKVIPRMTDMPKWVVRRSVSATEKKSHNIGEIIDISKTVIRKMLADSRRRCVTCHSYDLKNSDRYVRSSLHRLKIGTKLTSKHQLQTAQTVLPDPRVPEAWIKSAQPEIASLVRSQCPRPQTSLLLLGIPRRLMHPLN